jgi:hypothetical protein
MNPGKRAALEASLRSWYEADATRQKLLDDIVSGKAGVSLRTVDWAVTNYSVRNPVLYEHQGRLVDVNSDYKDVLRCFHKMGFDSFRRKGGEDPDEAELRQRNFFRWAIANGVVAYVLEHTSEIESDMAAVKQRKRRLPSTDKQRPGKRRKQKSSPVVSIRDKQMELVMPGGTKLDW